MPRSFLFTNRRYIPTPPPTDVDNDDGSHQDESRSSDSSSSSNNNNVEKMSEGEVGPCGAPSPTLSSEMIVAQILIRQAEQTEAVNLALHNKPASSYDAAPIANISTTTINSNNNSNIVTIINKGSVDSDPCREQRCAVTTIKVADNVNDSRFYSTQSDDSARPSVIYSVSSHNNNSNNSSSSIHYSNYSSNVDVSGEVGMDLSLKEHNQLHNVTSSLPAQASTRKKQKVQWCPQKVVVETVEEPVEVVGGRSGEGADHRSPPPPPPPPPTATATTIPLADPEVQDKSSLSDGDSDSGCSTQNEARSQLPPEVEYGWAECHAHFSLLYDLMTQGGRKVPGKEGEQQAEPYAGKEATEHAPHDYSQGPTREVVVQEPPVLYELMTESPRKASGRDVPDHAMEVEVSMQQYPPPHPQQYQQAQQQQQQLPHQQQYHHQQQQQQASTRPQYDDHRLATLQDVAYDRGHVNVSGPAPRYEPRRSLNDLLFAAGLPPVSPPSPPPLSPSDSIPLPGEDAHACEECGKRYSTSSNLARHRQTHRSHGDKKARKCPHCEKVYVSMPAFSMHVRTHNQGCACPHCGKRFSRPWLLQGHIRTHTGEKPFACPQCGKSFADKSNLRAHIQTHSSEKPYVCGRCGKAFALKSYLYKHEESSCMRGERFRPLRRQVSAEC